MKKTLLAVAASSIIAATSMPAMAKDKIIGVSWKVFQGLWLIAGVTYLIVTLISYVTDWESSRKSWLEGILFPGLISLGIILYSFIPQLFAPVADAINWQSHHNLQAALTLFLYSWLSVSMLFAYTAKELEAHGFKRLAATFLYVAGYGSFLCAVTFGAYVKELMGASMAWDKTEKTGKVG